MYSLRACNLKKVFMICKSRNTIAKNATSLSGIWQTIRLHYGCQSTGAHFLDFADIHLQADERPEDLYQRLVAFVEDNMLQSGSVILHHGDVIDVDEEMSPSLEYGGTNLVTTNQPYATYAYQATIWHRAQVKDTSFDQARNITGA